ncbi:hypothetical protein M3Y97_00159900 [Aphelenchoides bicaudatus]|nr:hypothetical protein M3Y97_00159900 [Aphelenchoides bicaudatus]
MEITPIELETRLSQAKEMFAAAAANGKPKQRLKALTEMRSILCSLETSELCEQFYNAVFLHIIVGTDRCYNAATRKKAAKCFQELVSKLLAFCEEKEEKLSLRLQVLDSVEARIFEFSGVDTHSSETALETARPALIAMNFLAQQCLKHMDVTLVNRFLNHGVAFLSDNRQVIRVLAIRLFRVFCKKLPSFMITQFQDYILESVFSAHAETESTGTIRRANQIFFDVLIGAFGYEIVCKYAKGQEGTLKLLKALEKKRRRRKVTSSSKKRKRTHSMVQ